MAIKSARTVQPANFSDAPASKPEFESPPDGSDEEPEVVNAVELNIEISEQPVTEQQVKTSVQETPLAKSPVTEQEPNIKLETESQGKKPSKFRRLLNSINRK